MNGGGTKCVGQQAAVVSRFIHGFNARLQPFPVRFVSAELILCHLKGVAGAVDLSDSRHGQLSACQRMLCCSIWPSGSKCHQLYKTMNSRKLIKFYLPSVKYWRDKCKRVLKPTSQTEGYKCFLSCWVCEAA